MDYLTVDKKLKDDVVKMVDSWPHVMRLAVYEYCHNAYNITMSNIAYEIEKEIRRSNPK